MQTAYFSTLVKNWTCMVPNPECKHVTYCSFATVTFDSNRVAMKTLWLFILCGTCGFLAHGLSNETSMVNVLKEMSWTNIDLIKEEKQPYKDFTLMKKASMNDIYVRFARKVSSSGRNVLLSEDGALMKSCILESYPSNCLIPQPISKNFIESLRQTKSFYVFRDDKIFLTFTF